MVREELAESVLELKRVSDRLMAMKLEVKGSILNIVSAYAPQVNSMKDKNDFLEDLDGLIESVSKEEKIVLGADLDMWTKDIYRPGHIKVVKKYPSRLCNVQNEELVVRLAMMYGLETVAVTKKQVKEMEVAEM